VRKRALQLAARLSAVAPASFLNESLAIMTAALDDRDRGVSRQVSCHCCSTVSTGACAMFTQAAPRCACLWFRTCPLFASADRRAQAVVAFCTLYEAALRHIASVGAGAGWNAAMDEAATCALSWRLD
jgi:L-alanine-DL-glutamate epimerase-like enolase superfamily enzyme